jgi:hypothetical protein
MKKALTWRKPYRGESHTVEKAIPWRKPYHGESHTMEKELVAS